MRRLFLGGAPVLALSGLLLGPVAAAPDTSGNPDADAVVAQIRQETERLVGTPRAIVLTSETAQAARTAIQRGDYAKAREITADVLAHSRIQPWRFHPFGEFMDAIALVDNESFGGRLDGWVAASPDDEIPLLVRAQYYLDTAWARRGNAFRNKLTKDQIAGFNDNLARAADDIDAAVRLRDDNPYSYFLNLRIVSGEEGNSLTLEGAFRVAIAKFPGYYPLYRWRLRMLTPKWGGSIPAMDEFVDQYAGTADEDSPMRMLYIAHRAFAIDAASIYCEKYKEQTDKRRQCVTLVTQGMSSPELDSGTASAFELYKSADKYLFGLELAQAFKQMIGCSCTERVTGAFLEQAAEAMDSDDRLFRDDATHGSYILDTAAGDVWKAAAHYENAETKYQHALQDIAATSFPDEEARDLAMAMVYDRLAGVADETKEHVKEIAYTEAAVALDGDEASS
jgi:hypothetical protein